MICVRTFEDLCRQKIGSRQHWHYVLLMNYRQLTEAGEELIDNLDYFDLETGEEVIYFIPGFECKPRGGFYSAIRDYFDPADTCKSRHYGGKVRFCMEDFVYIVRKLEQHNHMHWRYSGECELLLFNLNENQQIIPDDFYSYNMDDIIRNDRKIATFIRETVHIWEDANDPQTAKRRLDEFYSELIRPRRLNLADSNRFNEWINSLGSTSLSGKYWFISYSTRNYDFVNRVRELIESKGIKCWMAPRDIPSGTNYAHMIELAIRHADRFILMLSEPAVWSVWVEKELLRAISYFQHESTGKIIAIWIDQPVSLNSTPMGYPMEGLQIAGSVSNEIECLKLITGGEAGTHETTGDA